MAYDENFYKQYSDYLKEPRVREAHDQVLQMVKHYLGYDLYRVMDLGCGEHREYLHYAKPTLYCGIDAVAESADIRSDYRKLDYSIDPLRMYTAFVSLFSTEITAPARDNYDLYNRIFHENPRCMAGVVSGFYYLGKRDTNPIVETGDIVSYQTLDVMGEFQSPIEVFHETRITMHVPSRMFGLDVYEVWKFFRRK